MKIFLCRHGQTTGDIEDRFGGDYDDHLTDEGKKQAEELAAKLAGKNIEVIFTSPRIRAVESSEIIKSKISEDFVILNNIRERNSNGILTGMIRAEAKEKYPDEVGKLKDYRSHATGGEDYESFKKRVSTGWEEVLNSGYGVVAVVSHGGPIRAIFREILKLGEIKIGDCAIAEIEYSDGKNEVKFLDGIILDN